MVKVVMEGVDDDLEAAMQKGDESGSLEMAQDFEYTAWVYQIN